MDTLPPLDTLPSNYKILPIILPSLIQNDDDDNDNDNGQSSSTTHNLYIKPHSSADSTYPSDKTLYITNLPKSLSTPLHFKRLFRRCGPIESIHISYQPSSGQKVAYVVFGEDLGVQKVLEMRKRRRVWVPLEQDDVNGSQDDEDNEDGDCMVGLAKYLTTHQQTHHTTPNALSTLQSAINTSLESFDTTLLSAKESALAKQNVPDEDGFITVSRHGRRGVNRDENGTTVFVAPGAKVYEEEDEVLMRKRAKKDAKSKKVDFYRFQMRETKAKQIAELRKRFEEDKKKIQSLKATRRFKPY